MPANLENSAVPTGLEKLFSFQTQRRAMPKNIHTTVQLYSFLMSNPKECEENTKVPRIGILGECTSLGVEGRGKETQ